MMAKKAELFGDTAAWNRIMSTRDPAVQKAIGRNVKGYEDVIWHPVAQMHVYNANMEKFRQNPILQGYLLNLKGMVIAEASATDSIWGIGIAEDDPLRYSPELWRGLNWLGLILMKVRDDLIHESSDA